MSEPTVDAEPTVVEESTPDVAPVPDPPVDPALTHEVLEEDHSPIVQPPSEVGLVASQPGSPSSILPEGAFVEYPEA